MSLISFPIGLGYSHWSPGFPPPSLIRLGDFYQVTLIPTPIHSTELTSKREGICNVMITGPGDHRLHVIFLASAMSSFSYQIIVATTSLYRHHTTACTCHPHHRHILKQSRCEACRSNCETGRSNPSQDLGGVTNLELTARTSKH